MDGMFYEFGNDNFYSEDISREVSICTFLRGGHKDLHFSNSMTNQILFIFNTIRKIKVPSE